jgi:hypothetical protein
MAILEVVGGDVGDDVVPGAMARAATTGRVVLAVWREAEGGPVLGRFHATRAGDPARRRRTGGRIHAMRPGDVRVGLAMPHRAATWSADPAALRPEQALNRCVRGLLDGCRALGLDVFYPGRDVVTADGAAIAWISLVEEEGAALFEAGLSLPERLAAADVAAAVAEAYRRRASEAVVDVGPAGLPRAQPADLAWTIPAEADRMGEVATMLGTLGAYVQLDEARRLVVVRVSGDVIAPVETVRAIEAALRGVPALRSEVEQAVATTLADERRWVLGIDGPRDVAAAVMEAAR